MMMKIKDLLAEVEELRTKLEVANKWITRLETFFREQTLEARISMGNPTLGEQEAKRVYDQIMKIVSVI